MFGRRSNEGGQTRKVLPQQGGAAAPPKTGDPKPAPVQAAPPPPPKPEVRREPAQALGGVL